MRRLVITIFVAASLVGCSETGPSPSPAASRTAISTPVTVVTPSPDAPMTPSPTASPSAVPTPSPTASPSSLPTLTPLSKPSQGRGTWTKVKGSALVSPHAVAVRAGDVGVLLLGIDDYPCQTPERNAAGTPAAFYDARTHAIRRVSGDLKLELRAAASLPDGRVMVAGGTDPRGDELKPTRRTRIWDPRTRKWAEGAPMTIGRSLFSLVTLADGRLMAVGGMVADDEEDGDDCEGCSTEVDTAELYDPATNRWTPTSAVELKTPDDGSADQLVDVVALAGGQVLAIGANDSSALYDPRTETWTAVAWPRVGGAIALPDGTALGFGVDYYSGDSDAQVPFVERFDPEGGTRVIGHLSPTGDGATIAVLADGRLFLAGGVAEDETGYRGKFLASAAIFDPDTGVLSKIARMPTARSSDAVPLADGSVLLVGGIDVEETGRATEYEGGNDIPGCVPVAYRVLRWVP